MAGEAESMSSEFVSNSFQRPKVSKVWEHFRLTGAKKVVCTFCKVSLAYHGSTSAMHEHLKRKNTGAILDDGPPKKAKPL